MKEWSANVAAGARSAMSGSIPKPARPPKVRKGLRREGRIGKAQREWNAGVWKEWMNGGKFPPRCAANYGSTTMHSATCVGHIEGKDVRPDLRMDITNVAPICDSCNHDMKYNHAFRKQAQWCMKEWNRHYYKGGPA
jgi:hypothetical protein